MQLHIALNILLQLLLLPLLFALGLSSGKYHSGGEGQVSEDWADDTTKTSPPWLTFSTHDVELVMTEHENATIFLLLRGTMHDCLSINFTYEPANPTIDPINNFFICPDLNSSSTTTQSTKELKIGDAGSLRKDVYTNHPPSRSSLHPLIHSDIKPPTTTSQYPKGHGIQHTGRNRNGLYKSPSKSRLIPLHLILSIQDLGQNGSSEDEVVVGNNGSVKIVSRRVGKTVLAITTNDSTVSVTDAFVRVSVIHTRALNVASDVVGWMYTIIWNVSYMPQIFLNWRRKSVEGLSLDNIAFNFIAYLYYSLFNIGFCWIPFIKMYVIYRIKSTKGFSLIGVIMDVIGSILSLAQMLLLSANSDDYLSMFTNFSKFGIAILSLLIDAIYLTQHWYYHLRFRKKENQ